MKTYVVVLIRSASVRYFSDEKKKALSGAKLQF